MKKLCDCHSLEAEMIFPFFWERQNVLVIRTVHYASIYLSGRTGYSITFLPEGFVLLIKTKACWPDAKAETLISKEQTLPARRKEKSFK